MKNKTKNVLVDMSASIIHHGHINLSKKHQNLEESLLL